MTSPRQITDLSVEVLMEIFKYVPNKKALKSVCLDFYKIICQMQSNTYRLYISDLNIKSYKMITRSTRCFDEVKIRIWSYSEQDMMMLSEILSNRQKEIKKIVINFGTISDLMLLQLLILLPNLEEITLDVNLCTDLLKESVMPEQGLGSLSSLRSFTCNIYSAEIISELPCDVLKKLSFVSSLRNEPPPLPLLEKIFSSQKQIEELNFNPKYIDPDLLEHLHLCKLRLASNHHLKDILSHQPNLIQLDVLEAVTVEEFSHVCKLQSLTSLTINVKNINAEMLENFARFSSLKELRLTLGSEAQISPLCNIVFANLTKLEISHSIDDIDPLLQKLNTVCPLLEKLKISQVCLVSFPTLLNLKNLAALEITVITSPMPQKAITFSKPNAKLKSLNFGRTEGVEIDTIVEMIAEMLPYLTTLKIKNNLFTRTSLETLLSCCDKLSYITIDRVVRTYIDEDFFKIIREHESKIMYLEYQPVAYKMEIPEDLPARSMSLSGPQIFKPTPTECTLLKGDKKSIEMYFGLIRLNNKKLVIKKF